MAFVSYSITQAYYLYIQYQSYNVVPAVITLTFDSAPSTNPSDYSAVLFGGTLDAPLPLGFSTIDNSLILNGNTAALTMPVVATGGASIQIKYQNVELPFHVVAQQDKRYVKPSICVGYAYSIPPPLI
jgi:hypothetical protein